MDAKNKKEEYARDVCYFLAELLRTRNITLRRAAEIAQRVVQNINLIDSEEDFLKLIIQMEHDFEELADLEQRVHLGIHFNQRREIEYQVRTFVSEILPSNSEEALQILLEAIKDNINLVDLENKFPDFKRFVEK